MFILHGTPLRVLFIYNALQAASTYSMVSTIKLQEKIEGPKVAPHICLNT